MNACSPCNLLVIASMTPVATANCFVRAFHAAGHTLRVASDVPSALADARVRGAVHVPTLLRQLNFTPDAVLFFEGGSMQLLPTGLEQLACVTAWYGIDTHMDYAKHVRIGRLFDASFIAQQEYVERLRADGVCQVSWLPLAFAPELMPDPLPERDLDIAFVGSVRPEVHPQRHALLAALQQAFPSHYFGGAEPREMHRLYARARLVFNKSVNNDVNMRFFEAAGAGAVLLTDPVRDNGVETLFARGEEYVEYADAADLLVQARALLADPARCSAIASRAHSRVLAEHTYRHRAGALLAALPGLKKMATPAPADYLAAALALDLLGPALAAMADGLRPGVTAGRYRRIMGRLLAGLLGGCANMLSWLERLRHRA